MCVVAAPAVYPAEVLSTLKDGPIPVTPTERWTDAWTSALTTSAPNVYGIYARSIPLTKWLDPSVRDLLDNYPGDVGSGVMPAGFAACTVPGTYEPGLGDWVLLYVGKSSSDTPRIVQYFGTGSSFTREPGGHSFHLSLALFLGGTSDPRNSLTPRAQTLENVLRGSLGVTLEQRMRDMRLAYVQVVTPICVTPGGPHLACGCMTGCEQAMLRDRVVHQPPTAGWPTGARPLLNAAW